MPAYDFSSNQQCSFCEHSCMKCERPEFRIRMWAQVAEFSDHKNSLKK